MVRTLGNAIARERLAHAFLLTGVRGVGKTSTARLIAKALNCVGPDGAGGPTINPCGICEPCQAIAEGRHIDVVEMDAASHTGVDDVREIIEAVRYAAVSARYKVYIIDEVHMLSKNAFNALLKTLEEPPAHVKFLFATTEIQKVPVTVLSRCQRFDLKRIPAESLAEHFADVLQKEGVEAEDEALSLIARAAEGSVRDGLSILDQAISHGQDKVSASQVRDMLGLSDRSAVRELFGLVLAGDPVPMLAVFQQQYELGTEPVALFRAMLELVHGITRTRVTGGNPSGSSAEERAALADWGAQISYSSLHRLWQLLLKALNEVHTAPVPMEAAEMALLRIMHAASMPDPSDLLKRLEGRADETPATTVNQPHKPAVKADTVSGGNASAASGIATENTGVESAPVVATSDALQGERAQARPIGGTIADSSQPAMVASPIAQADVTTQTADAEPPVDVRGGYAFDLEGEGPESTSLEASAATLLSAPTSDIITDDTDDGERKNTTSVVAPLLIDQGQSLALEPLEKALDDRGVSEPVEAAGSDADNGALTAGRQHSSDTEVSPYPADYAGFVQFVEDQGGFKLAHHLYDDVGVIHYAPPEVILKATAPHMADVPRNLAMALKEWTGVSWVISYGEGEAQPSLREQDLAKQAQAREEVLAHPFVKAALDAFPQAELVDFQWAQTGKA